MTQVARFSKDQVKAFVKDNNLKTMEDVQSALKELYAETQQSTHDTELMTSITRRQGIAGTVRAGSRLSVSTARSKLTYLATVTASSRPVIVKKHQKSVTGIEDQIIAKYAKGINTRDSNVTNKVMPIIKEWHCRSLQGVYAVMLPST